jgi:hypothetical protein
MAEELTAPDPRELASTEPNEKTQSLAEARAKFEEILAKRRAEDSDEEPKAKPEKKAKAPAKPAKAAQEEPPKEDPETKRYRAKLALAGYPEKAMESLSGDDLREWWQKVEERESAQAKALERASVAEKKLKALTETAGDEEPKKGVPTSDPDLEEIAAELADQFGESEAGVFLKALHKLTEPLQAKVNDLEGIIRAAQSKGVEDISAKNRNRLSESWPHLKDNDRAWSIVQQQVLDGFKADPSRWKTPEAAFDDVIEGLYGGLEKPTNGNGAHDSSEDEDETADLKDKIAASAPSTSERKGKPRPLTPMDAAKAAYKVLLQDPDDVVSASRAYRRAAQTS